jgi:hypothetical protein
MGEPVYPCLKCALVWVGNIGSCRGCGYKILWDDMNISVTG